MVRQRVRTPLMPFKVMAAIHLERGETARATAALESVLRDHPRHPEAHWHLALLDQQRGRYESAEAHLRAFLSVAGDRLEARRRYGSA